MPGRPRKPTKLHVLHGTLEKSRHRDRENEPVIAAGVGEPPDYLGEYGRAKWIELATIKGYSDVLTANHRATLEHFCVLYQRLVEDARGVKSMSSSDRQTFHSICMQLGLTPASQSKISAPKTAKPDDPWSKFG